MATSLSSFRTRQLDFGGLAISVFDCALLQEVTYIDRMRHRLPNYPIQTGMKDHVDNGSLSHWADENFQRVYAKIFDGE